MNLFERYLARSIFSTLAVVLFALMSMDVFLGFLGEASGIGKGRYTALDAFLYVLLTMPSRLVQLLPSIMCIAAMLALGALVKSNELTVFRATGVSIQRIAWALVKIGLILAMLSIILAEFIAPRAELYAQQLQAKTLYAGIGKIGRNGTWIKDGENIWRIRNVISSEHLRDVTIYHLEQGQLHSIIQANNARYEAGQWILHQVKKIQPQDQLVSTQPLPVSSIKSQFQPDSLEMLSTTAENLSFMGILDYIAYLKANRLDYAAYSYAMWGKILNPLSLIVMLLLALPFAFGSSRSSSMGQRLLVGVMIGLLFYLLNQMASRFGLLYGLDPFSVSFLPTLVFGMIGWLAIRKVF